jgi:hypothetical protein
MLVKVRSKIELGVICPIIKKKEEEDYLARTNTRKTKMFLIQDKRKKTKSM